MNKGIVILLFVALFSTVCYGQSVNESGSFPTGSVVYSLPSTTIGLKVVADHESFAAGPYAKYAAKYLGTPAREQSGEYYSINSIELIPYVEADPDMTMTINLGSVKKGQSNFLAMTSQGLVATPDGNAVKSETWRFKPMADNLFSNVGIASNLEKETTTLYKTVETEDGVEMIPVQQTQLVEKSLEKKAEETAAMIFKLRQKRIDIITGDTDATYSGEAMGAALDEMTKLEQDFLSLFYGRSVKDKQTVLFEVMPKADMDKQVYVAFRFSESQGLLPANNMGGRPVIVEVTDIAEPISVTTMAEALNVGKNKIIYRKPVTSTVKVIDGQKTLLQTRVPVYQFGKIIALAADLNFR